MSLQLIAKQMEAKGRKGDSMLVHMTPGEVAGLQKLAEAAGGSLTVNPETGLVEANFLKQVMPALVSGALMASGIGMPLAIAGGALTGGIQARRDDGDFLSGALMGGISGYGGATLAGGLGAAGAANAGANEMAKEALRQQALSQTSNIAANMGAPTAAANVMPSGFVGAGAGGVAAGEAEAARYLAQQAAPSSIYGTEAGAQLINDAYAKGAADYANKGFFDRAGEGFKALGTQTGRDAAMAEIGGGKGLFKAGLSALTPAAAAMDLEQQQESPYPLMSMDLNMNKGAGQGVTAYEGPMPSYNYQGSNVYIPTFRAAEGGLAELAKGGMREGGFVWPADVVSMIGEGNTEAGYKRIAEAFPGSVPIRGEDGGQADTVKTSIEGKQPARVAHGEVYSKPTTVERAGGAKKLYAIMDRVREQATGSKKQIKPVRLESAMA